MIKLLLLTLILILVFQLLQVRELRLQMLVNIILHFLPKWKKLIQGQI